MGLKLKKIERPCDCPQPCYRYQIAGVQFPASPTSITVDGNVLSVSGTANTNNELVVLLNTALINGAFADRFYYNAISGGVEVDTDFVYSDLLGLGAATLNKIEDACPQEVVPNIPFAVLGGRISYDPNTKRAVIFAAGYSTFGALVLSNPQFSNGSGSITTTNVPNDTMDFSVSNYTGNIEYSLDVSDGTNTATVVCVAHFNTENGSFTGQKPTFAMVAAGQLGVTMDLNVVGANWLTPPYVDGYDLNGTGNTPFTSPATLAVASGDSLKLGRGDGSNEYHKQYCQWYIYL